MGKIVYFNKYLFEFFDSFIIFFIILEIYVLLLLRLYFFYGISCFLIFFLKEKKESIGKNNFSN